MRTRKTQNTKVKRTGISNRKSQTIQEDGKELFGQLVRELTRDDTTGRRYGEYLRTPDPDRSSLLTAHIIVERLIESTLETRLPFPDLWIPTADFSSKIRLARALGLIREDEHRVCSVLNAARNALAHELEPLAPKWRAELKRLALGRKGKSSDGKHSFQDILLKLVSIILAHRNRTTFYHKRFQLREQYSERWLELMKQRIHEALMSDAAFDEELLNLQVDLQIARESNQHTDKTHER